MKTEEFGDYKLYENAEQRDLTADLHSDFRL